jgi:hypothetical protein
MICSYLLKPRKTGVGGPGGGGAESNGIKKAWASINYLLTYDSYVPLYNRFHRGEWITRVSGGEGALDTPGPLNGTVA